MSTQTSETKPRLNQASNGVATLVGAQVLDSRRSTPQRPPLHDAEAARAVVISILRRIEGYLDEETIALDKVANFDLKASNDRKSQGLVDLNQAMRRLRNNDVNEELQSRLQAFRKKLAINLHKIRLHLDAVREITAMLADAIQSADSDGTYTRHIGPIRSSP